MKDKIVITRETISNIEAKLPQKDFMRVHRSFIVNLSGIDSFTHEDLRISGKEVPISRSYKKALLDRLGEASGLNLVLSPEIENDYHSSSVKKM